MICAGCKAILSDEEEEEAGYCNVCHKPFCDVCTNAGLYGSFSEICKKCASGKPHEDNWWEMSEDDDDGE